MIANALKFRWPDAEWRLDPETYAGLWWDPANAEPKPSAADVTQAIADYGAHRADGANGPTTLDDILAVLGAEIAGFAGKLATAKRSRAA